MLVIHPSVPAKTLQEFIALAKAKPGSLNYATTGTGNLITTEMLKSAAGINVVKEEVQGQGLEVVGSTPEALAALIVKNAAKHQKIGKEIGLKPQ